jgi:hypothetical protein
MAGSEGFTRTQSFQGEEEQAAHTQPVQIAIVYRRDGTMTAYRNGRPYGAPYKTGFATFPTGQARVLFGLRHSPAGGNRLLSGRIFKASLYDHALSEEAVAASAAAGRDAPKEEELVAVLTAEERDRRNALRQQLAETSARRNELESRRRTLYTVRPGDPEPMRIHIRGSVTDFGDVVPPGAVAAVHGVSSDFKLSADAPDRSRRLKLARWITAPRNPLFRRVIINRLWQHHFGTGLVTTSSDFGFNGGQPSHPELLDWLAGRLGEEGFRLKPLHRLIVTSATYRQASTPRPEAIQKDSANRLLWRYSPRRIEAEILRDSMLHIAGRLDTTPGGPGFRDVTVSSLNGTTYYLRHRGGSPGVPPPHHLSLRSSRRRQRGPRDLRLPRSVRHRSPAECDDDAPAGAQPAQQSVCSRDVGPPRRPGGEGNALRRGANPPDVAAVPGPPT